MHTTPLGPLMIDLVGTSITEEERQLLMSPLVGGVILFARQFESKAQIRHLVAQLHRLRTPRLLIAVDYEGGRVQRFRTEFTRIPPMGALGELYAQNPDYALELAYACGFIIGVELSEVGIDLNFGPVLDIGNPESQVIGDRSFNADPHILSLLAKKVMLGMKEAGMAAVGKHFPGHGGVEGDSHLECPHDERSLATLKALDLIPYEECFKAGMQAIMTAHIVYGQIDPMLVTFSSKWLKKILRDELGFKGIVFSDDLSMEGAAQGSYAERVRAALCAGCDIALVCNANKILPDLIKELHGEQFSNSTDKIKSLYSHPRPHEVVKTATLKEEIARFVNEKTSAKV